MTQPKRILALAIMVVAVSLPAFAQSTVFMSVDEVRAGMKGIGRTVFQGTAIEQFDVELLGVLKNFAPKQDMILARLSGGPLAQTGVIAGMSGSPVYIDGKLLGAVAFAFPFAKEPIAGIQPISQMVNILNERPAPAPAAQAASLPTESPAEFIYGLLGRLGEGKSLQEAHQAWLGQGYPAAAQPAAGAPSLVRIETPLFLAGATPAAIRQFTPFFNAVGFTPVQGGGGGSASSLQAGPTPSLQPGSAVNAELIRGDVNISANGTVTHVDGNRVYAFGHPNMSVGPTDLPMSAGYVISLLPNIQNSFKLAVPMDVVGSFDQDRATGIAGTIGRAPKMIPMTVNLRSSQNTVNQYKFEIANDRFLTPLLMNFTLFNAITASERGLGEMTLDISGSIRVKDYDPIRVDNVFSGDANTQTTATIGTIAPVQYLMNAGYDGIVIEGVDLDIVSTDRKTNAQLERISVDKTEVRPGETVILSAFLRATTGDIVVERHPVQIPSGLPAGPVQLLVGDGTTITTTDLRRGAAGVPKDMTQIIKELNNLRKNDRLYIKILSFAPAIVIGGEELPSLPPSMAAVINTDRSSSRSVSNTRNSTIGEIELPQSRYVIQGQRSLNVTVRP